MTVTEPIPDVFAEACRALGLVPAHVPLAGEPLTGGVSSDIWRIDLPSGPVCAKRALAALRVKDDWQAPVRRHHSEADFLRLAGARFPGAVPELIGHDASRGVVVMAFLPPADYAVWKARLSEGVINPVTARAAGNFLSRLHASFEGDAEVAAGFADPELIYALRLSPYFEAAAARNPPAAAELKALVALFANHRTTLIHGDFSPKNMLVDDDAKPIIVDAETAAWGDPAFDVAFCLTHLFLKAVWKPQFLTSYQDAAKGFIGTYFTLPQEAVESRASAYLAGMLLARVDGKSTVEYLIDERDRGFVRQFALNALAVQEDSLMRVQSYWYDAAAVHAQHKAATSS